MISRYAHGSSMLLGDEMVCMCVYVCAIFIHTNMHVVVCVYVCLYISVRTGPIHTVSIDMVSALMPCDHHVHRVVIYVRM